MLNINIFVVCNNAITIIKLTLQILKYIRLAIVLSVVSPMTTIAHNLYLVPADEVYTEGADTGSFSRIELYYDTLAAGFSYAITDSLVSLTDSSLFADSLSWDFGDETYSTEQDPTHIYSNTGTYTITLTAYNDCGSDTFSQTLQIINTGLKENQFYFNRLNIFPNPNKGKFMLEIETRKVQNIEIKLLNLPGQLIFNETIKKAEGIISMEIEMPKSSNGIYLLNIVDDFGVNTRKVVVY